jgi:hypothetical protein
MSTAYQSHTLPDSPVCMSGPTLSAYQTMLHTQALLRSVVAHALVTAGLRCLRFQAPLMI